MAILLAPGFRTETTAGVIISGGRVRVYGANTTNLATLFSDAGLTVPLTNPVTANSAGYPTSNGTTPTLIYLADGNYDVAVLGASGDNTEYLSLPDVPSYGSDGATFSKDFTGSRVQMRNSGGVLQIESGDPSGDNSGGKVRVGGWASTQGDEGTWDYAESTVTGNMQIDGDLYVGGQDVALDSVVATGTSTNAATVDIPLTGSGRRYQLELANIKLLTATQVVWARLSYDNGSTYKSGAADYGWSGFEDAGGVLQNFNSTGATRFTLNNANMATTDNAMCFLDLMAPANTTGSFPTWLEWRFANDVGAGPNNYFLHCIGRCGPTYGKPTHIRILASSGNISLQWRLIKMNGFPLA